MDNKTISGTKGYVGFIGLICKHAILIPRSNLSLRTSGQDTSGKKKYANCFFFFPIKSDEELPYTI